LAITRFKSLSIYYKFTAWLICLTNFLRGMFSSFVSVGKSYPSGQYKSTRWLCHCQGMSREQQDASRGLCQPCHERQTRILLEHIRKEPHKSVTRDIEVSPMPAGHLSRSNDLGHSRETGHPYFTRINFAIEPPTPAMARGRVSLRGWQECLFGRHSRCPTPFSC